MLIILKIIQIQNSFESNSVHEITRQPIHRKYDQLMINKSQDQCPFYFTRSLRANPGAHPLVGASIAVLKLVGAEQS